MKPHLPAYLFQALLTACVASLATSAPVYADVPEGYKPVTITNVDQLARYTQSDYIAFVISSNITNSAYRMTGGHQYWTDDVLHTHVLTFEEIESAANGSAMSIGAEFVVEDLHELSFSQNVSTSTNSGGGAIFGGSACVITLNNNGSVEFSGNTASSSSGGAIFGDSNSSISLTDNGTVTFSENSAYYAGGAIYAYGTLILSGNGSVTFSGNTAVSNYSEGGAIHVRSTLNLMKNETVTFSGNSASYNGGAIYGDSNSSISLTDNGTVTFSGNSASPNGGAICANGDTLNMTGNGTVTFSGNSASYAGGAIHGGSACVITLNNNGRVEFSGNSAQEGGAIYGYTSNVITLCGNEIVTFSENSAQDGGAISGGSNSSINLTGNGTVTFSGNSASINGGAIDGYSASDITLNNNGSVEFIENSTSSDGGAIYASCTLNLTKNETVTFSRNSASAYGGAIWASGDTLNITDNGTVTFSGNSTTSSYYRYGGAIYARGTLNMTGNESVMFSENFSENTSSHSNGGAIYGGSRSSIILTDNGTVTFSGNSAGAGGAIYGDSNSDITLNNNGSVEFIGNSASSSGAIYVSHALILTKNETVTFRGNSASDHGGAICGDSNSSISLTDNGTVTFSGNSASAGGAIYTPGALNMTGNGSVTFSGNSASNTGGAIWASGDTLNITDNGTVTFSGNSASNTGGAIWASRDTLNITDNGTVTFSGNSASISGAISGGISSVITLNNNECVEFIGNSAQEGGAIEAKGTLNLTGNSHVVFQGNYNQLVSGNSTTYVLRSVVASKGNINLSAGANQDIVFYDTLYANFSSTVSYNAKYVDQDGMTQEATGDIVFSGARAEEDLRELTSNYTQQELTDSLTTEVETTTNLYGGRLRIEDGAIYKGCGINVVDDSNAILRLGNGSLDQTGYGVSMASGTILDLQGANRISAVTLDMQDGSSLSFTIGVANLTTAALTLDGTFNQGGNLTIDIQGDETYDAEEKYMLITMASGVKPETWDINKITLSGADTNVNHLMWENDVLYYSATPPLVTAIWNGEQSREWNFSDKNWEQEEVHYRYKDGVDVVFGNIESGAVELVGKLRPKNVLVENGAGHDYSFAGEGSLSGASALTKRGEGKLTIATANTYTGGTVMEGGTLVVGNSAALGTGKLQLKAGLLDLGGNTIANNVITQGEVSIANGGIAGKVSMSDTVLEIEHDVTISGKITASSENLITVDASATLSISQTIANSGSYLEIAGAVDVSNIAGTKVGESSYIGGMVQGNGFEQSNMRIQVISDSKTSRHDISEASFIYKGAEVELDSTCAFNVGETDYAVFYVNSGTESLGTALDSAEAAQVELSGVVMKSGTELAVDRNASTDLIQVKSGKATMNIAEGVTLSETNATRTDFILQGAGQYQLASGSTTLGATLGDNWKGAVQLVEVAVFEDFDLNKYGKAGSVVRMDGASVKLAPSNNVPFLPTLGLTGEGMTITGCYAGETYIFAGGVIGDGDFVYNPTSLQHKQTYIFTGDVSQWTGAYESTGNKTSTLKFYGDAMEMGAAIKATAGTINVEVGNGTDAFASTFGNDITASSLKVLDKAAATLTKDTTIAGKIEVAGSLKIQGEGQLNVGDAVRMGAVDEGTPATLAGVDISSTELGARGEGKAELSGVSITTMDDFKLENVRLDGSFIDIGEDTTFYIKNVEISADTRITDGAARMFIEGGKAFLDESNTEAAAPTMSLADVTFYRSGDTETWVTLRENVSLVSLTSELFTKVMLTGTDLWLDLTGLSAQVGDATAFSVSFEDGALFDVDNLRVYASLNGEKYLDGYTTQQSGGATTLYFSAQIPEPSTGTLTLLALTAMMSRRKRTSAANEGSGFQK